MQRPSHQDLRRHDGIGGNVNSSDFAAAHNSINASTYAPNVFPVYWPTQDDASTMASAAPQPNSASGYHEPQLWQEPPSHAEPHPLSHYDSAPNHGMFDLHYGYANQSNSLGLKAESGLNVGLNGELDLSQRVQREQRPFDSATSDALALLDNLPFKASSSADNDSYEDSTDSDLPPEKKKLSAAFRPRGRKKRNKCTPEQLHSLEAFFEKNRNPTGRIRLELSRKLRMPERSVQVWFQNRRAKVKTVERRGDPGSDSSRKKSCSLRLNDKDAHSKSAGDNARLGRGDPAELVPSVTAIPTSALCIGTWRRVSPLICFFSRRLQSLTWYLTSESIGFKLEIPWTSIRSAYFDGPSNPSIAERAEGVRVPLGHFVIDLERPPTFFMEVFRSAPLKEGSNEEPKVSWRQCEDFTEDHQAMTVSRHVINGPYEELRIAVQALARCNDVLKRLIKFHDEEQRAAGTIPTGSASTADNFGLVGDAVGVRSVDAFASSAGAFAAASLDMCAAPMTSVNAYANGMHVSMQSVPMSTSSSASSIPKSGSAAWHNFRTPMRMGAEPGWEFDSPASVSTSLSEASLDSQQRHPLAYSPYGVPTSIEASPRSALGSSMDLNTLRIDTGAAGGGMSGFSSTPHHMPLISDGSALGGSQAAAAFNGWDARLSCDLSCSQRIQEPYSLASSGVFDTNSAHHTSSAAANMPTSTMMDTNNLGGVPLHRNGDQRHDHASNHAVANYDVGLQQTVESSNADASYAQENKTRRNGFDGHKGASNEYHYAGDSGSLLDSRRLSHTEPGSALDHAGYDAERERESESDGLARRSDQEHHAATLMAAPGSGSGGTSSSNSGSGGQLTSLEEDAFCAKTPTTRTCFGVSVQMSGVDTGAQYKGVGNERQADDATDAYESGDDAKHALAGRARSNTYRSSTHGGRRSANDATQQSDAVRSGHGSVGQGRAENTNDDHQLPTSGSGQPDDADARTCVNVCGLAEVQIDPPTLVSLSSSHLASREHSPASSSISSVSSSRSLDQHAAAAEP